MSDHARLAPSSARRLIACPGYVGMCTGMPNPESVYAAQGSAAHWLLDGCFMLGTEPQDYIGTVVASGQHTFTVDEEMAEAVGMAIDYVRGYLARYPNAKFSTERRVYPGRLFKRDDCWGTLDISLENQPVELVLADYKHGVGIYVDAENNEQLFTYALGVIAEWWAAGVALSGLYAMPVRLVIIQPRHRTQEGPVREFVTTLGEVMRFKDKLSAAAKESDKPDAKLAAGDHCRFCPARKRCPEFAAHALRLAQTEFVDEMGTRLIDPSSERFAELLRAAPLLRAAADAWETEGQRHADAGGRIPGFKLVRGKGSRSWYSNADAQSALISQGYAIDIVAPRSLLSPNKTEELLKTMGTKKKLRDEFLKPLVNKRYGSPTLVAEEDPRPEIGAQSEFNVETPE